MKKLFLLLGILAVSVSVYTATTDESIQHAKARYAAGNYSEAINILDEALKKDPGSMQAKRTLADICVDTGEKEYDIKNYKNAYEYFKKAVKALPTHPIASERYWKMKKEFDVNNLKNEGGELSSKPASGTEPVKDEKSVVVTKTEKKSAKTKPVKEINTAKAEEIYTRRVIEMEERINRRLLEMNAQLKKPAVPEKKDFAGLVYSVVSNKKYFVAASVIFIILILILIISANYIYRIVRKRMASLRGEKEYEKLFGSENSKNYNELIKMQNINEMLNKVKSGDIDWATIRKSISEMDRELRLEIFSYIETKSEQNQQPLTMGQADILMALLLDGDEYLRKRASSFVAGQLAHQPAGARNTLAYLQGPLTHQQGLLKKDDMADEASCLTDLNVVLPISKIADRKVYNDNHAVLVGVDAYNMAWMLGLSQEECTLYYIAGLLHDVGYLSIPSDIMNKKATLSENDISVIRTHTKRGVELLDFAVIPDIVREGILYHHEEWGGDGYPEKLSRKKIPLVARVIAIFDMYEALVLPRPYRPPFPANEAARVIKNSSGTLFDPDLIKLFDRMVKESLVSRGKIWKD